ncbi:MAG TPA: sugar ABC transporter substrate-binding protein [Verrucomicrobiales bacterium]|nr:sugar ABC transporter substrate-binding protein [Verrucomicrobiales bacterium]
MKPFLFCLLFPFLLTACKDSGSGKPKIGVAFETLQTEFWVAGFDAIKKECAAAGYEAVESVADGDANRQLEQVQNLITRKVDGIILVPKDAQTCLPMIKAANDAGIPISLFNRPAAQSEAKSVAVVADNFSLTKETVLYMIGEAKKTGQKHKAMVIMGDLGDMNAIGRRDGFEAAVKEAGAGVVEVVSRVPSEWNQEKAQAGVTNALQANADISFIFTSSDFLLPSIVSALKAAGKYHKAGEPGHVILGGFDGDATAWSMLKDGYLDATGVQDVYFEAKQCVQAIVDLKAGKTPPALIIDAGFVIHRGNMNDKSAQMWGANIRK